MSDSTPEGVRIVRAGPERLDHVESLWRAMFIRHREVGVGPAEVRPFRSADESWRRRRARYETWLSGPDALMLLAERDGAVTGYAVVVIGSGEASIETGERVADLASLSAVPQGEGIGSALIDAVHAELRTLGVRELTLSVMDGNTLAMRFYERLGMRPYLTTMIGRVPDEHLGK